MVAQQDGRQQSCGIAVTIVDEPLKAHDSTERLMLNQ
jgi:hypothetical protein